MQQIPRGASAVVSALALLVLVPQDAYAYLDPGSGSYFLQIVLATFVSAMVAVKLYWRRFVTFLTRRSSGPRPEDEQNKPAS